MFQQNLSTTQLVSKYRSYKVSKYLRTQQGLDITGSNLSRVIQLVSCILTSLVCTMSEATTGVLKFAFGLISNKLQFRELDNIKSKLDAISRKDLCTSISCFQQGVNHLIMSFGESSESGNPSTSEIPSTGASSIETKPVQQSVTVKVERFSVLRLNRRTNVISSSRRIMRFVPVFILKTHNKVRFRSNC